jgi:hypothetical protein
MQTLLLPLLFVATLVGVGAFDLWHGLHGEPPPATARLIDGSFAAWLEERTKTASPAMRELRPWWYAAMFSTCRETPSQVVVGPNGWLFYAPSIGYGTEVDDEKFDGAVNFYSWMNERAAEVGSSFRLGVVPSTWRLYPEQLGLQVPASRLAVYDRVIAALRAKGVDVIDMLALLKAQQAAAPEQLVVHPFDSHLAAAAYEDLVVAMAPQLAGVDSAVARARLALLPQREVTTIGDMAGLMMFDRIGFGERFRVTERHRDPPPTADRPDCEIILIGDSYAAVHDALLPRLVSAALGATVDARAAPLRGLEFARVVSEYQRMPRYVLVFMSERHFVLNH